jgi:hypothetical protein
MTPPTWTISPHAPASARPLSTGDGHPKRALITDTLLYWRPDLLTDAADTGSLAGDLDAIVERVGRNENDLITTDLVLRVALADLVCDPELASALDDLVLFRGKRCSP